MRLGHGANLRDVHLGQSIDGLQSSVQRLLAASLFFQIVRRLRRIHGNMTEGRYRVELGQIIVAGSRSATLVPAAKILEGLQLMVGHAGNNDFLVRVGSGHRVKLQVVVWVHLFHLGRFHFLASNRGERFGTGRIDNVVDFKAIHAAWNFLVIMSR